MVAAARSPVFRGRCPGHGAWALGLAVITMLEVFAAAKPTLLLNRSPSEPPGLYVRAGRDLGVGSIIAFRTPSAAFPYANLSMAYLHHRPLLKAVAAGPGDRVCTTDGELIINGRAMAPIAKRDRQGRALPRWQGCRRMTQDELFVFSDRVPNSFDSRYYGPVHRTDVLGSYRWVAPLFMGGF
jgi:conjugative transfer signal peptidase TraF